MKRLRTSGQAIGGKTRRQLLACGALGLAGWIVSPLPKAAAAMQSDLDPVSFIPQMAHRDAPLLIFRDFIADPDGEVERHLRRQIGQRKDLLSRLKRRFDKEKRITLSVVGGMVGVVLRRFCHRHQLEMSPAALHPPPPVSSSLPQYRYRDRGHRLVGEIGLQTAMYMRDPMEFRDRLLRQPGA